MVEAYADRLTITSYGGLVPGLSKEEFFAGRSMIRNRELMRVYRDLELVEQLGSGMNRILQAYPKDVFRFSDNFMEVCFTFDEEYVPPEQVAGQDDEKPAGNTLDNFGMISERIRKECGSNVAQAFEIIYEHPRFSAEEIAAELSKTPRTVENYIAKLKQGGFIIRKGPKLGGHWEVIE